LAGPGETTPTLRPYLDCITDAREREEFLIEYRTKLTPSFPNLESGGVPFVFRRIFIMQAHEKSRTLE
jgi:trans-aconitate methyltransferase